MAVSISFVLANQEDNPSLEMIVGYLSENWSDVPSATDPSVSDEILSFNVGSSSVYLAKMRGPVPWSDLEGPCATSILWPNAEDHIKAHRFHWLVTVVSDLDDVPRASLLTQVTASLMNACPEAIGVYWGSATLIVPKELFIEFAREILPEEPPLYIWVDFRVGSNSEDSSWGFTAGLAALGHMEIEAEDAPESPRELHDRLYNLADYVLEHGPVIKDGHTVGDSADEKIRVTYSPSVFGHKGQVIRLYYDHESSKSPWWKLW